MHARTHIRNFNFRPHAHRTKVCVLPKFKLHTHTLRFWVCVFAKICTRTSAIINRTFLHVNLCQMPLFLHQLTHNMTTDCSLNYRFNIWKFQAQTWGQHVVYRNFFWQFLYTTCSPHVLHKEESFWQRFTYTWLPQKILCL